MQMKRNDTYEDILHLPRHVSKTRKQMSLHDRAAQFAPFAALTGHDAAVKETARLTETKIELDENEIELLDQKLQYIAAHLESQLEIIVTYFVSDERKAGGKYVESRSKVKKIDHYSQKLYLDNGDIIPIQDILRIAYN